MARPRSTAGLVAAVLSVLGAAGCGSDAAKPGGMLDPPTPDGGGGGDGAAGGDGPAVGAFEAFVGDLAEAVCAWQFHCCGLRAIDALSGSRYLTMAECIPVQRDRLSVVFTEARLSMREGRMTLDPSLAAACVSGVAASACIAVSPAYLDAVTLIQSCRDPFVGKVPAGDRCYVRDECVAEARCVAGGTDGLSDSATVTPEGLTPAPTIGTAVPVVGACLPYRQEGDRCNIALDCAPGLYCKVPGYLCARPAGDGEPCVMASTLGSPNGAIACDDVTKQRVCNGDVCGRLPREGEPCLTDGVHPFCDPDPALDLACVGTEFSTGICKRGGRMGDPCGGTGVAPCSMGLVCLSDDLFSGLGTCWTRPRLGDRCNRFECADGAVCDPQRSICVAGGTMRDGERCQSDIECASLSCALTIDADGGMTGSCQPPYDTGSCGIGPLRN